MGEDCMPLTHSMATKLGKKLTDVRKSGELWWLRPDGKTQVTIEYVQKPDGSVEPTKVHTVVISTQLMTSPMCSRLSSIAVLAPLHKLWHSVSQSTRQPLP